MGISQSPAVGGTALGFKVVQGSFTTDGSGHATLSANSVGVTGFAMAATAPHHITVTFAAFASGNYSVHARACTVADNSLRVDGGAYMNDGSDHRATMNVALEFWDISAGAEVDLGNFVTHGHFLIVGA